jgi:hypothetical protein
VDIVIVVVTVIVIVITTVTVTALLVIIPFSRRFECEARPNTQSGSVQDLSVVHVCIVCA